MSEQVLRRYQITASGLDALDPDTEFFPCPSVTRGQEVSRGAMLHPPCRVIAAKAFQPHAQGATLERVFERYWPHLERREFLAATPELDVTET